MLNRYPNLVTLIFSQGLVPIGIRPIFMPRPDCSQQKGRAMKIKYEFANEVIEIEVEENWGRVVLDLDRQEYNNEHAETRRHCSFEAYSIDGNEIADRTDILKEVLQEEDYKELYTAIEKLKPRHRKLIIQHYLYGVSQNELAKSEGVTKGALSQSISCAIKNLKKFLKKT